MPRRNRREENAGESTVRLPDRFAYHASSSVNRGSILKHGLDVTRMGEVRGIAGSETLEVEGIFLAASLSEALWFASFPTHSSVDVWVVDMRGLRVVEHPDGFVYYPGSIPLDRVRLDEADLDAAAVNRRQSELGAR